MKFSFGHSKLERVEVDVLRYERQPEGVYWEDDNWLVVNISVAAGGFKGRADASFLTSELLGFLSDLRTLYSTLKATIEFTTLETQLTLRLNGDGKGHIGLEGTVLDQPGIGNKLNFNLQFDQSQLAESIRELEQVVLKFPVRGSLS